MEKEHYIFSANHDTIEAQTEKIAYVIVEARRDDAVMKFIV